MFRQGKRQDINGKDNHEHNVVKATNSLFLLCFPVLHIFLYIDASPNAGDVNGPMDYCYAFMFSMIVNLRAYQHYCDITMYKIEYTFTNL